LKIAVEEGFPEIVSILLNDARVDSSVNQGFPEIVEILLNRIAVSDPSVVDDIAIRYTEVLELLLEDARINPPGAEYWRQQLAVMHSRGETNILRVLFFFG